MTTTEETVPGQETNKEAITPGKGKKKKGFGGKFLTFLMMGGWLLILIVVLAIVIGISVLTGGGK